MKKYYYMNDKTKVRHLNQNDPNGNIYNRQCANRAKIRAKKRKKRTVKKLTIIFVSCAILATIIILLNL